MGYTHYWRQKRDFTEQEWIGVARIAKAIFQDQSHIVAGWDGNGDPEVDMEHISFNGVGRYDSHESCTFTRLMEEKPEWIRQEVYDREGSFNFCKTARKPYDIVVVHLLGYISRVYPDIIVPSSDGGDKVFENLGKTMERLIGYAIDVKEGK